MKTKHLLFTAILTVLSLSMAYADDAYHADKQAANKMMNGGMGIMENMQQQMKTIHNARDPDKRDRLIDEHMKSMQKGMQMMGMSKMDKDMSRTDMHRRMKMMEKRMDMMQVMMDQMMKSNVERVKTIKIRKRLK